MAVVLETTEEILLPGISVNRMKRTVAFGNRIIKLTFKEFDLFYILAKNPHKIISREQLLKEIWHEDGTDIEKVAVHMTRLRKKLNPDKFRHQLIRTIWGAGYLFAPEVKRAY